MVMRGVAMKTDFIYIPVLPHLSIRGDGGKIICPYALAIMMVESPSLKPTVL